MSLSEDQAAKIILIRSVEESDTSVFSEAILAAALASASHEKAGLAWIEKRAAYLFEHLSPWHQAILQLAKVPAHWTLPVCLLALALGLATNLLGSTKQIHVVRNPVFFLVAWNLLVYLGLILHVLLRNRIWLRSRFVALLKNLFGQEQQQPLFVQGRDVAKKIPWLARHLMPQAWQFIHKVMYGFNHTRKLANLCRQFTVHWYSFAGAVVVARWKYLLHLAALCLAFGAVVGMYFRGLLHGYEFVWASTFVTDAKTVASFIHVVFGPSFYFSSFLNLGLGERIDLARLVTPAGDISDAWIHLLAITVLLTVVIPRAVLALTQANAIATHASRFGIALDDYYGEVIEAPIRSIIVKEAATAIQQFAKNVAAYVGASLYVEAVVPKLRDFREHGGRIADLKADLTQLTEAFSPQVKAYILDTAIPAFRSSLSQRVGEIIKNIGTDFVNSKDPEAILQGLDVQAPGGAELVVSDQFSRAVGVSVGAAITLTFATVGGGIGEELGIAIIAALLGTSGPVGFLIGLILGGVVAAGAWWFGKDRLSEAVDQVKLPALVVRAALWDARFTKLIEEGRSNCEASVRAKVEERLTAMLPKIADEIMFRIRALWGA